MDEVSMLWAWLTNRIKIKSINSGPLREFTFQGCHLK